MEVGDGDSRGHKMVSPKWLWVLADFTHASTAEITKVKSTVPLYSGLQHTATGLGNIAIIKNFNYCHMIANSSDDYITQLHQNQFHNETNQCHNYSAMEQPEERAHNLILIPIILHN